MLKQKVFFMHIAKTAGSKVNTLFQNVVDGERYQEHCEFKINEFDNLIEEKDFISGHVYYMKLRKHLGEFYKFTVLRSGVSHLSSHLLWLDHYNLPEKKAELNRLSPDIQEVVYQIANTDINDYKELDYLLCNLDETGIKLLDNCQSRYFLNLDRAINMADIPAILATANEFDRIVFQDNFIAGIDEVFNDLGMEDCKAGLDFASKVNEKKSQRKIDVSSPILRQVLSRRCMVDERVFNLLKSKRA
ncbi:hypothetical protein BK026_12015 [Alteromonas sp. V450]|uniref:hypothetical protein n=1 Tax=Alteromonas sp. V450 TaxID=1912139 RepID=UPI0008FF4F95|nr:hypothetical protein [Alteromonas sp. V450]OJF69453.1 hypothetical protein BK026_12015 [Alteromonas sp. V450]